MANFYVRVTRFFEGSLMAAALKTVSRRDSLDSRALSFSRQLPVVRSYFSHVTKCPIRSVFIVLTEKQPEPDPSQGFPELFSPSVTRKRDENVFNNYSMCLR